MKRKIGALVFGAAALLILSAGGAAAQEPDSCRTGPCHRDVGRGAVVHQPVRSGDCGVCHRGDGTVHPAREGREFSLPAGNVADLCLGCHGPLQDGIARALIVHDPVRKGDCLSCHRAHEGPFGGLLRAPFPQDSSRSLPMRMSMNLDSYALCWKCHDKYIVAMPTTKTTTAFREGSRNLHYVHVRGEEGYLCTACHRPHAAGKGKLLERAMDWTEDIVGFEERDDGGACTPGCHERRVYSRQGGP